MTEFILNDRTIRSDAEPGTTLLDVIRYHEHLPGTKIGCREGDCGACTVLVGELKNDRMDYRSMTSCLLALANVHGKHIVTVEGLTDPLQHGAGVEDLSMVQQALVNQGATQCGICTPGFVVSLSGCCLSHEAVTENLAIRTIDGNICRCTGYKSIERAAADVARALEKKDIQYPVAWSVKNGFVPAYFSDIEERLRSIQPLGKVAASGAMHASPMPPLAGGTDLYVQKHDTMHHAPIRTVFNDTTLKGIRIEGDTCIIGGATVANDLLASKELHSHFPNLEKHLLLVSSTPIRNMGTLAGNFVNASPIGDLTAFFIALDSTITLRASSGEERQVKLKDLYKGYKDLDRSPEEILTNVRFKLPTKNTRFNFEKVSKRTYLDIASVNTAIRLEMSRNSAGGSTIREAFISAGGVAPVPKFLANTAVFLVGKEATPETVRNAVAVMNEEIAPISDARGSADYKRLLLRQLLFAHFMELFPERFKLKELV
ncbi:MAG: FAD binding domain-containing protein [Flavobacteriales bacterium]|jgi:xanthine dehydrogenase small subunit|nr:FAD binding domain-containing protein [Flavobacteriales bacterium]MCB0758482.1 FAD binding domain-containing protein [Flavobacteriales bacterium]